VSSGEFWATSAAEAALLLRPFAARLKPCPDEKQKAGPSLRSGRQVRDGKVRAERRAKNGCATVPTKKGAVSSRQNGPPQKAAATNARGALTQKKGASRMSRRLNCTILWCRKLLLLHLFRGLLGRLFRFLCHSLSSSFVAHGRGAYRMQPRPVPLVYEHTRRVSRKFRGARVFS
jgi:hypothetical protein